MQTDTNLSHTDMGLSSVGGEEASEAGEDLLFIENGGGSHPRRGVAQRGREDVCREDFFPGSEIPTKF